MVPLADILNHVSKSNAQLKFAKDHLEMRATKPIRAVSFCCCFCSLSLLLSLLLLLFVVVCCCCFFLVLLLIVSCFCFESSFTYVLFFVLSPLFILPSILLTSYSHQSILFIPLSFHSFHPSTPGGGGLQHVRTPQQPGSLAYVRLHSEASVGRA